MSKLKLGEWSDGKTASIDLARLIETRALIQANSGGGKSYALRRCLELTAGHVQQLIIDPEGEFSTLREKHDLVICSAQGGDALAHPKFARMLALRLLETEASAVLDLYELKAADRHLFVKLFVEALLDAPKSLRHSVLVPIDEIHIFCPEKGQGESIAANAIVDLASRGRKRGLCLIGATQRIGKFNKSAAAELKNKLIGSTGLDIDVKRAAFELGLQPKDALQALRSLEPGHFFGFGPALNQVEPRALKVGEVFTTHPTVGHRQVTAPPKPTAAILALLPKLADLPKEAEEEARTLEQFKQEVARLKRELKAKPTTAVDTAQGETAAKRLLDAAAKDTQKSLDARDRQIAALRTLLSNVMKFIVNINAENLLGKEDGGIDSAKIEQAMKVAVAEIGRQLDAKIRAKEQSLTTLKREAAKLAKEISKMLGEDVPVAVTVRHSESFAAAATRPAAAHRATTPPSQSVGDGQPLTVPQQRILDALLWLKSTGIEPAPKESLAAVTGVSPTSGGYFNNLGKLRSAGLIDYQNAQVVFTEAGEAAANPPAADGKELHERWLDLITEPQRKILSALLEAHPAPIEKDQLAELVGVSPTSGGYFNNLGRLRTLGAIDYPQKGSVAVTKYVVP